MARGPEDVMRQYPSAETSIINHNDNHNQHPKNLCLDAPLRPTSVVFHYYFLCWDVHLWISMCTFRPLPPRTPSPTSILYLKKHGNFLSHGCNFERLQRPARISQRTMVTYLHAGSTFLSFSLSLFSQKVSAAKPPWTKLTD